MGGANYNYFMMQGVGALLRSLRQEAGLTQREAARRIGTTQAVVSDLENGKRDAFVGTLEKFANAYGMELELAFVTPQTDEEDQDDE